MRRYRAAPYYFGTWAIIMGAWLMLMVVWTFVVGLSPWFALVSGFVGLALLYGGTTAVQRSRTSERVPDTAVEAIERAREAEARDMQRPGSPGSGALP